MLHASFHVTYNCNLCCEYCYEGLDKPCIDMDWETAKRAVDFCVETDKEGTDIVFFGGEPLLKKNLIHKIVEYTQQIHKDTGHTFFYKMSTNATLLDEEFLKFADSVQMLISISIDGPEHVHNKKRVYPNGQGSFEQVDAIIPKALKYNPYINAVPVVNPDTAPYLYDTVKYLFDKGFRFVLPALNYSVEWSGKDFKALERSYKQLAKLYIEKTRNNDKFYLSTFDPKINTHTKGPCKDKDKCHMGLTQISIAPNGDIYPCVQFVEHERRDQFYLGDIYQGFIEEKREIFRDRQNVEAQNCKDCALEQRCHNTCGCLNWATTGTLNQISPFVCEHERMGMKIADSIGNKLFKERDRMFINKHYNEAYPVLSFIEDYFSDDEDEKDKK